MSTRSASLNHNKLTAILFDPPLMQCIQYNASHEQEFTLSLSCSPHLIIVIISDDFIRPANNNKPHSHLSPSPANRGGGHEKEDGTDNNETNRNASKTTNRLGRWKGRRGLWPDGVHEYHRGCGEAGDQHN